MSHICEYILLLWRLTTSIQKNKLHDHVSEGRHSYLFYGVRAPEAIDDDHLKAAYELLSAVKDISRGIRRAVASCCSTILLSRGTILSVY